MRQAVRVSAFLVLLTLFISCDDLNRLPTEPAPPTAPSFAPKFPLEEICPECYLGPVTLTRQSAQPAEYSYSFSGNAIFQYELVLEGNRHPLPATEIWLNGDLVVDAREQIKGRQRVLRVPVSLIAENRLRVRLLGQPGSSVRVRVEPLAVWVGGIGAAETGDPKIPILFWDEEGNAAGPLFSGSGEMQGAVLLQPDGTTAVAFFGDLGLPDRTVVGSETFLFNNWIVNSSEVSVDLVSLNSSGDIVSEQHLVLEGEHAEGIRSLLKPGSASIPFGSASFSLAASSLTIAQLINETSKWLSWGACIYGPISTKLAACASRVLNVAISEVENRIVQASLYTLKQFINIGVCVGSGYLEVVACLTTLLDSAAAIVGAVEPHGIAGYQGMGQHGEVNSYLFEDLGVLVTNMFGDPLPAARVSWWVATGGGSLRRSTSWTGLGGVAYNSWRLGPSIGQQSVRAEVGWLAEFRTTFYAQARTGDHDPDLEPGEGTPSIDGVIGTAEWANAASVTKDILFPGVGTVSVRFLVMNDDQYIYTAAELPLVYDPSAVHESFGLEIDADRSGDVTEPDEYIGVAKFPDGGSYQGEQIYAVDGDFLLPGYVRDDSQGGTNDIDGDIATSGGRRGFEIAHPLDSSDDEHDMSVDPGDTIGIRFRLSVDGDPSIGHPAMFGSFVTLKLAG